MVCYSIFMAGQWFLLGKEIDHRLKIYFKVNSSMDRVIYRLLIGKSVLFLYFGLLSLLPDTYWDDFFWGTWITLGLFYSWPTRGKIIQETVSTELTEFKFLDSFEQTILALIILLFFISFPGIPTLDSVEALKLYFDRVDKFAPQFWNFLYINYYPFHRYPDLLRISWCVHFYFVGIGFFLLAFYGILRVFLSRRLSLLGILAFLSSWSFCRILFDNFGSSISSTYSLLWIWCILWGTKSATYRSGLFIGLLGFYGTIINQSYFFLLPVLLIMFYLFFLEGRTFWFKRQLLKYSLLGLVLGAVTVINNADTLNYFYRLSISSFYYEIVELLHRKAFFYLSWVGLAILLLKLFQEDFGLTKSLKLEKSKVREFAASIFILFIFSLLFDSFLFQGFSLMAFLVFFCLLPLEWIFQSLSGLRSKRNMILGFYIVVCLLDSHLEGRLKIVWSLF